MEESSPFYRRIRRIQILILRLAGLIPFKNRTLSFAGTILMTIYVSFTFVVLNSFYIWTFIVDCRNKRFNPDVTSELCSFLGFLFRFTYMLSRRKEFAQMLRYADSLWERVQSEEKHHVRLFVRTGSKLSVIYSSIILVTITLYVFNSQLPQWTAATTNETIYRALPWPFYVDVQSSPYYEIVFGVQFICVLIVGQVCVCIDMAIAFLIMIACGHFRLIKTRLEIIVRRIEEIEEMKKLPRRLNFHAEETDEVVAKVQADRRDPNRSDDEMIRQRARDVAAYHQKILDFCENITKLSSEIFMIELISTTYNLSLIGILLAGNMPFAKKLKFSSVLFILTTQLFVCHYPAGLLLQESVAVSDAAYFVPPFRRDQFRIDKILLTLLTKSQKPYQLLAGGQIVLSMESFGSMIKGAVSFFTVLRNFN